MIVTFERFCKTFEIVVSDGDAGHPVEVGQVLVYLQPEHENGMDVTKMHIVTYMADLWLETISTYTPNLEAKAHEKFTAFDLDAATSYFKSMLDVTIGLVEDALGTEEGHEPKAEV